MEIDDAVKVCKVIAALIPLWPPIELKTMEKLAKADAAKGEAMGMALHDC